MQASRRVARAVAGLLLAGLLVVGCALLPTDYTLHVINGTSLTLTVVVNTRVVGVVAGYAEAEYQTDKLPGLPWAVEARSTSGRVILTLAVAPGSVTDVVNADGSRSHSAPGARVDLSCGRLDMYPGNTPMLGPAPGPGVPGDCVP
jgi:hypothetical protein